jgi:signal transduction histidine kinase
MFLISHTMGPILGNSVPLALYLVDPTPGFDILVLALSITAFWIFPFLLRRGVDYDRLVIISVINLNFCIFWSCYFNGGVLSPTLPWVLLIPILSFFYIGGETHLQSTLMAIFAGIFGLFFVLYYSTNPSPNDTPAFALVALGVVSTVAALCYVATMAIYYASIFDAGVELENEVRRRRLLSDELRAAIVAADQTGLHKAEFLARMSHELRTPLNAVIGYSQILREDAQESNDPQMQEDVSRIHDAGQYLLRLINIILDLSKIEAGRMQFTVETHELVDIVREAISATKQAMRDNGNTLELFLELADGKVDTDKQRLVQIVEAVLDNVPAHAPGAHVEVRCREIDIAGQGDGYAVSVRDNGEGIPPERLATLFEALADRRDASISKYGGTGLSLTVVHKLVQALGCSISAESTVGSGTCITVVVPKTWAPRSTRTLPGKALSAAAA